MWLEGKESSSATEYFTMLAACVGLDSTGSNRNRLICMVDALRLPMVFFTHSAANTQCPELTKLIFPNDQHSSSWMNAAIADNSAIVDWLFFLAHRIDKFINAFYIGILGAMDYWFRFELEVHVFMILPGFPMPQMWKSCWSLKTSLTS